MIDNSIVKIINNKKSQKEFHETLVKINKLSSNHKIYMAIDFEFSETKIALMQILFEVHKNNSITKKYFIIYPPSLYSHISSFLINKILCNRNILKITHGADALDLPYVFYNMFNYNQKNIIDFTLSTVDTKYLCEYIGFISTISTSCKIYDILNNLKILSDNDKIFLEQNEEIMNKNINNVNNHKIIDIDNLQNEIITYAIHDVVYLPELYFTLKKIIIKNNPKNYFLLIDAIRFAILEKKYITTIGDDIIVANIMNNYFFYLDNTNKKIKLLYSFELILDDFINSFDYVKLLFNIKYIKNNITDLLKIITYELLLQHEQVFSSINIVNNIIFTNKFDKLIKNLKILELNHLSDLLNKYILYIKSKIISLS